MSVKLNDKFLGGFVQKSLGNIDFGMNCHGNSSSLRVNIRSNDSRLRKGFGQLLRRLIVGKHMG